MSCGCGCNNCGDEKPRVNGTEVTILSGLGNAHNKARKNDGQSPKAGTYAIVGTALTVALIAAYVSCRKGS